MTRHPKKKDIEKKSESSDPNAKNTPPADPMTEKPLGEQTKNPLDKLFWIRVGFGVLAGTIAAQIGNFENVSLRPFVGVVVMVVLFMITYGIAKAMRIPIAPSDKKKLVMTGIGSYFFMFIFSWILVNTITHPDIGLPLVR